MDPNMYSMGFNEEMALLIARMGPADFFIFHYELQYTNRNTMTALSTMRNSYTNNCKNIPCILESLRCVFLKIDYYPLVPDWGDHVFYSVNRPSETVRSLFPRVFEKFLKIYMYILFSRRAVRLPLNFLSSHFLLIPALKECH